MDDRARLGREGERRAEQHLRALGYRIVTRNYRGPGGEIDLVALDRDTVVFVEVRTRRDDALILPEETVVPAKQQRIVRTAGRFLRQTGSEGRTCRFDVLGITVGPQGRMAVNHVPQAFIPVW